LIFSNNQPENNNMPVEIKTAILMWMQWGPMAGFVVSMVMITGAGIGFVKLMVREDRRVRARDKAAYARLMGEREQRMGRWVTPAAAREKINHN